jgi:hypothetical protein
MSDTTKRILDDHPLMNAAQLSNDGAQFGLFAGIFSAVEKALEGPAHFFVLPAALFADVLRTIFTIWEWFNANNKNLRKTAKMFLEIIKTAVIGTAIIGTMAGCALIAAITPFLFVGGLATTTLYHAVLAGYHGYKWYKSSPEAAPHHKKLFFINLWVMGALAALTTAVSLVLAFKPEIGIFKSVAAYFSVAMSGISTLLFGTMAAKIIFSKKKSSQVAIVTPGQEPEVKITPTISTVKAEVVKVAKPLKLAHEDLIAQLNRSDDATDRKAFVFDILTDKDNSLAAKAAKAEGAKGYKGYSSYFYKDQTLYKRNAITLMRRLVKDGSVKVSERDELITTVPELMDYLDSKKRSSAIFHSFFREVGEMQKIFILVDNYLQTRTPESPFASASNLPSPF